MSIKDYVTLGRSGLRVSPLCLGTMTFGIEWGIGTAEEEAHAILRQFLEAGGNFIDTANVYNFGSSEKMLGKFLKEDGQRDRVVLATKFTFNLSPGDPNGGGNGRKSIYQAVEASLHRLQTDYIDLYWLHAWHLSKTPGQVALNWIAARPGVTSTLTSATKPAQLAENLAAIEFEIPAELAARLDEVSTPELTGPYRYFTGIEHARICGETSIRPWSAATHLTGAPPRPATE